MFLIMSNMKHFKDAEFNDAFNQDWFFFFFPNQLTVLYNRGQRKPSEYIENSNS